MNIISEKAVWINLESDRYFIIPHNVDLPEGDFELKTIGKDEKSVQQSCVKEYEVTEAEAHQWMQDQVNEQMNRAKDAVKNDFANRKKENQKVEEQAATETESTSSVPSVTPTLTMVIDDSQVTGALLGEDSVLAEGDDTLDEHILEAVSILNKAITQIELSAAQAVSELQALKEKMTTKMPV